MPKRLFSNKIVKLLWTITVLVALLLFTGCRTTKNLARSIIPGSNRGAETRLTEAELRERLTAFYVKFADSVEAATFNASLKTDDLELQERLIHSRLRIVRLCRETVFQRRPQAAFLDT